MSLATHRIKKYFEPLGNVLRHVLAATAGLLCVGCAAIVLLSFGLSATAQQVDTKPPELTSFALRLDVFNGNDTYIRIVANATDNSSGLMLAEWYLTYPDGSQQKEMAAVVSGTTAATLNGSHQLGTTPLLGNYTLNKVCVFDQLSNNKCFSGAALAALGPKTFVAVGGDTTLPVLTGFSFTPTTQNIASAPGNLNATVQFTDNASGVAKIDYSLAKPDGSVSQHNSINLAAGTAQNGSMQFNWPLPAGSPSGTYTLSKLCATDVAGNIKCYESAALLALNPANSALVTARTSIPFNQSATSSAIVINEEKDPPATVFNVTKTASGNPFIGGKPGQFYTINIAVQNGRVSAPILLLDKLPSGVSTSGPITAVGASISNCPATGATDLAGCTLTTRGNSSIIVVTVPISVAAGAVSGANTATVKGGGSLLCTGIAPACSGSTGPIAIVEPVDAVDDAVMQPAGGSYSFNVAANDKYPAGSQFAGGGTGTGSTCLNASVSAAGIASYVLPAFNSAAPTCVIQYQVCAPASSLAGCDSAYLRVTAYPVTAVPDSVAVSANTAANFNIAANDAYPAGAQFNLETSGSTCLNAQVSNVGVAGFTSPASGATCTVKYKLCAPAPYQTACSSGNLNVNAALTTGCGSLSLTYQATVPSNSPANAFSINGNGCNFFALNTLSQPVVLTAGSYKLVGTVVPLGTTVAQAMSMVTFTLTANGFLKGKAEYDTATSKWKLVQVP